MENKNIIDLESYVDQIDTSLYHDFIMNKRYFKNPLFLKLINDTRDTCDELFRKIYK